MSPKKHVLRAPRRGSIRGRVLKSLLACNAMKGRPWYLPGTPRETKAIRDLRAAL